jgi:hypothetical protein
MICLAVASCPQAAVAAWQAGQQIFERGAGDATWRSAVTWPGTCSQVHLNGRWRVVTMAPNPDARLAT